MANKKEKLITDRKHFMIIFGCMLLQGIPYAIAQNTPPLFIRYLHLDFGFDMTSIGFIITMGAVASSLIAPFGGKFYNKFSTKLIMIIGLVISCSGLFINSIATNLTTYYIASAIIQIGSVIYSTLGVPFLIGLWFDQKNKAKALGIAFAGGSIGNLFIQPIFSNLLHRYATYNIRNLHLMYFFAATTALILGITILIIFIHDYHGQVKQTTPTSKPRQLPGIGTKKVKQLPSFWLLATGLFFIGLNISAQSYQYANYFSILNIPAATIGIIGSTFAAFSLLGNISGGFIFSKLGIHKASLIAFLLQFLSCTTMIVLYYFPQFQFLGFLWGILYGLSVYIYMSGPAILIQDLFGMRESSETLGTFNIFFAVGFAIGNIIFGKIVDTLGYLHSWYTNLIFIIIGFSLLAFMIQKLSRHNYDKVQN